MNSEARNKLRQESAEENLKDTFFLVEADDFAKLRLWSENHNRAEIKWEEGGCGYLVTVGHLNKRPVAITVTWDFINEKKICFWEATSELVDHKMIKEWLARHFTGRWDNDTRPATTNAMNFHHCLHAIQESKKKQKYFCFEIATENHYELWADTDEKKMESEFAKQTAALGDEVETYAIGTCEAESIEAAHDLIRAGKWEYSQRA
jgi:hypothetical protein